METNGVNGTKVSLLERNWRQLENDEERRRIVEALSRELVSLDAFIATVDSSLELQSKSYLDKLTEYRQLYRERMKSRSVPPMIDGAATILTHLTPTEHRFKSLSYNVLRSVFPRLSSVNSALASDFRAVVRDLAKVIVDRERNLINRTKVGTGSGD